MRPIAQVLFLILLGGLVGCEGTLGDMRRTVPEAKRTSIETVGVVSTLGDTFYGMHIATTVFGNQYFSSTVDWGVDVHAAYSAASYIEGTGRRAVILDGNFDARSYPAMLISAKEAGVDTLIVVTPSSYDNQPHFEGGYGLLRDTGWGRRIDCIYSLSIVEVFDVDTGRKLGWQWGMPRNHTIACYGDKQGIPWNKHVEWREGIESYTPEEQELLKANVLQSLSDNIPAALERVGLR